MQRWRRLLLSRRWGDVGGSSAPAGAAAAQRGWRLVRTDTVGASSAALLAQQELLECNSAAGQAARTQAFDGDCEGLASAVQVATAAAAARRDTAAALTVAPHGCVVWSQAAACELDAQSLVTVEKTG